MPYQRESQEDLFSPQLDRGASLSAGMRSARRPIFSRRFAAERNSSCEIVADSDAALSILGCSPTADTISG